jgi:hypothetical protein
MLTAEQAREIAAAHLARMDAPNLAVEILDASTHELSAGWVYFYQAARYLRTQDFQDMLVGNSPLFVPKNGSQPQFLSHHLPFAEAMEAFEFCGNVNARTKAEVQLRAWLDGANKVAATQAIRSHSSLGLAAAHAAIEKCLAGEQVLIATTSVTSAHELASQLKQLQFVARVTYADDGS